MKTEAIATILSGICPAFYRGGIGAATWHTCYCKAQPSRDSSPEHCTCVWHETDKCLAGIWPQLAKTNTDREENEKKATRYLHKAKAAIKKAQP